MPQLMHTPDQLEDAYRTALEYGGVWIAENEDGSGRIVHLVSDAEWTRLREAERAYRRHVVPDETESDPTVADGGSYQPFLASPKASIERILPTDWLQPLLAKVMFGKDAITDLDDGELSAVTFASYEAILGVRLDADDDGIAPILAWSDNGQEATVRWSLAHRTGIAGLYLREEHDFFGTWRIVTSSGWQLLSGFHSREDAERFCAAVDRALNLDWRRVQPVDIRDTAVMARMAEVVKAYGPQGTAHREHREPYASDNPALSEHSRRMREREAADG